MALQIVAPQTHPDTYFGAVPPSPVFSEPQTHGHRLIAIADRLATEYRNVAVGAELAAFLESEKFLFVVMDGWMFRNAILEDGRRQILDLMLPGDMIVGRRSGYTEVSQSIDAITDATVALIPIHLVSEVIQEMPSLALTLLAASQDALYASYESLVDTGRRTSLEAVAHFLVRIEARAANSIGRTANGTVSFPLIQEHIGDAIGLTAVHVCRTLRKLKTAGVIEMGRGWLKIVDRGRIAEIAGIWEDTGFETEHPVRRLAS